MKLKKNRIGFVYAFNPTGVESKEVIYKGDVISGLSVDVLYKIFSSDGQELLFSDDETKGFHKISVGDKSCSMTDLLTGSIDKTNKLKFIPDTELLNKANLKLEWEIRNYYTEKEEPDEDFGLIAKPYECTKEEFVYILENHIDHFDCSDNRPASTPAYFTERVETIA